MHPFLLCATLLLLVDGASASSSDDAASPPDERAVGASDGEATSDVAASATPAQAPPGPPGMIWIPGGEFTMGSDRPDAWTAEQPAHRVRVDGFWIDPTEVTNRAFAEFVDATGYRTVAERPIDWEVMRTQLPPGTPKPDPSVLVPGSMVFTPPAHAVPVDNPAQWWTWAPGASWRHPEGPGSSIEDRLDHPVVHVAWEDAVAYCNWAGRRLPTEAEWECAARGGLDGANFVWGDTPFSEERPLANVWQGNFPNQNRATDGFTATAPVGSFPANGYGLHDMAGNVWEWCADWFDAYSHRRRAGGGVVVNPKGPARSFHPEQPYTPLRVEKGGSYLCHPSYCSSYRPSARMGNTPDTGMSHLGFRTVSDPALWAARQAAEAATNVPGTGSASPAAPDS